MTSDVSAATSQSTDRLSVSAVIPRPVGHVWEVLVSPLGAALVLGDGAELGAKGEAFHTAAGPHGVVRSFHPQQQLRVSWHDPADGPASLVEIDLDPDPDGTRLTLSHEHVPSGDVPGLTAAWAARVDALVEACAR